MDPATINSDTVKVATVYLRYDRYTRMYYYVREKVTATVSKDPADTPGRTWVVDPYLLLRSNTKVEVEISPSV